MIKISKMTYQHLDVLNLVFFLCLSGQVFCEPQTIFKSKPFSPFEVKDEMLTVQSFELD